MPWNRTRKSASQQNKPEKQQAKTESIARQCYENRLKQNKPGDAESDWVTAEKITQNRARRLAFHCNSQWLTIKPLIPFGLIFSVVVAGFTWWLEHQTEIRQETTSQNLNHQRIFESYIDNFKEIELSSDYKNTDESSNKIEFIKGMTLPVLRELTDDENRKAQLVLFLYQMNTYEIRLEEENQTSNENFLATADLKFAKFKGYKLTHINLQRTDLRGADLESVDLIGADLTSANLSCHLRDTDRLWSWLPFPLPQATKEHCTVLKSAQLNDTNLSKVKLHGANLTEAKLTEANLSEAELIVSENERETKLINLFQWCSNPCSSKSPADLTEANLNKANLTGANLNKANLTGADLTEANFSQAELTQANLSEAIILSTDLRGVTGLTKQQLEGAQSPFICNADLPKDLTNEISQDRDCEKLADVLHQRDKTQFPTPEDAQDFINEQRGK